MSIAPYHILIHGKTLPRAMNALSGHPYGAGRVQNMSIFGSKSNYHERLVPKWDIPSGKCLGKTSNTTLRILSVKGGGGTPQTRNPLFAEKKIRKGGRGVPPNP